MRKFLAGLVLGLILGGSAAAVAAVITGDTGFAHGWTVVKDGEQICSSPYIWVETKEIECD